MEITKINETYKLSEEISENSWKMEGTASKESDGSIQVNFSVNKTGELEGYIGNFNYHKPSVNGNVDVSFNVSEENRDAFMTYTDSIIDQILLHFKEE